MGDTLYELTGAVEQIVFRNDSNGYTVLEISAGDELITVVGSMPGVKPGDTVTVQGRWTEHPSFGRQFKAESSRVETPQTSEAIFRYLSSGSVKGVGPVTAGKIVDLFGEDALRVMEEEPERLCQIKGITRERARKISGEIKRDTSMRQMLVKLGEFHISPNESVKIWKKYGAAYQDIIENNPYQLCSDGIGIDFFRADSIAQLLEKPINNPYRIRAGILYVLRYNLNNGHTCLPTGKLMEAVGRLLGLPEEDCLEELEQLITDQSVISLSMEEKSFIYLTDLYKAESYIAYRIGILKKYPAQSIVGIENYIRSYENRNHIAYAGMQKEAIRSALGEGLLILTGGPGTGKTTTLQAVIGILKEKGERVLLAAPTGRAAKRMSDLTGEEAKTIHRLLQVEWDEEDRPVFAKNEKNLLECDALILDELSMVDALLFESLLRALPLGCRLIMVGDRDQLPSVGPGNILGDLIASGQIPVVQLREVFRQAMESLIVMNAHRIVSGEMPELTARNGDFFFMKRKISSDIVETIVSLCGQRLPNTYGFSPIQDIQVLCPGRKGELGTQELNRRLQEALNPPEGKQELKVGERIFREGDKVMQVKNNYNTAWEKEDGTMGEGVFNGDIGIVETVNRRTEQVIVRMDDRQVTYDRENLEELELAYAMTVHKSQGNEFKAVVLPMYPYSRQLLYRNLLYTAITRAKTLLVLVGREEIVHEMVQNNRKTKRYTGLAFMLEGKV